MKLQRPLTLDSETQYLTHCTNIANILALSQSPYAQERIKKYIEITGAGLENSGKQNLCLRCRNASQPKNSGKQNLCPRCHAEVEFAQDPLRICTHCGWRGDYTKLEES